MPFSDPNGAVRLVKRIDEILALVRSWPIESGRKEGMITVRVIPKGELARFDELDAKIGALMTALGFSFPPSSLIQSVAPYHRGFTRIRMIHNTVDYPEEWEERLTAVRHAAQEMLEVAQDAKTASLVSQLVVREPPSRSESDAMNAALNWLQAKLLENDADTFIIQKHVFHEYLLSVGHPVAPTVDTCITRGWIEEAQHETFLIIRASDTYPGWPAQESKDPTPISSVPGYRILAAVRSIVLRSFAPTRIDDASAREAFEEPAVDARANNDKLFPKGELKDRDIAELVIKINTEKGGDKSINQIARDYTGELKGSDRKAMSMLSEIRRLRRQGLVNQ